MDLNGYKKYLYSKDDSQKDDFSLNHNRRSISPQQSVHIGDNPVPRNSKGELLIKKPLKEKSINFEENRSRSAQKFRKKVDFSEEEEDSSLSNKKNTLLNLQRLNLKNYINFAKNKNFSELSESQNNTHDHISILKQSNDFFPIDSTKNNDTKHFILNKEKIIEEADLSPYKSPIKVENEHTHFELKDIITNPSHILHSKEDIYQGEEKLLNNISENHKEVEDMGSEEKKDEIFLIGKESESLKGSQFEKNTEESVILLPPMPNAILNVSSQNPSCFISQSNSQIEDIPFRNTVYLKKKFSLEKKKIGFSTISMRRDLTMFNPQEEKEIKSGDSFKLFNSNLNLEQQLESERMNGVERFPTNKKVMNELDNIEKHIILKRNLENFIILFNDKPEDGIAYLLDSNMIKDTEEDIARVLLNTEGLSKITLGKYFGEPDPRNQKLFQAFCNLFNFQNMDLEEALRLLLSQFILPGESQQIDRIVQVFSEKYMADNASAFVNHDIPYILAYSILMLNTDAHSSKIQNKSKMKKHEFALNNMKVCPGVSMEYFEKIYDRIVAHEIMTKIDYIETVYNKTKDIDLLKKELEKGHKFLKYGRKGKPKQRLVFMDINEERISWKSSEQNDNQARFILISEIIDISTGVDSTNVMRKNKVPIDFNHLCFSLITKKRSLDLKADDIQIRYYWVQFLKWKLIQRRDLLLSETEKHKKKKNTEDKEKISEIWKVDILPNWELHWDYQARKPRNLDVYRKKKKQENKPKHAENRKSESPNTFSKIMGCFKSSKKSKKEHVVANEGIFSAYIDEEVDTDEEIKNLCRNRSLLLVILWKKGIPPWIRKTLWPIVIGNRLEINNTLYNMLLKQVSNYSEDSHRYDRNVFHSLKLIEKDIPDTIPDFKIFQEERMKKSLLNMLQAFIFYRPDVGYVKGMSHLAAMLLLFLAEYDAFYCLINLTHSHHFLSFLRGDMREIQWRVKFFDKHFERELPQLYDHFKAVDLSTEIFLFSWFLTLFSGVFNCDITSRIWDCFLLDGEIYGFKTSLGILKYYELELRISTFDEAINILKDLPKDTNEERLFKIIEEINIPFKEYATYLENQKMAEINTQIHQALLFVN